MVPCGGSTLPHLNPTATWMRLQQKTRRQTTLTGPPQSEMESWLYAMLVVDSKFVTYPSFMACYCMLPGHCTMYHSSKAGASTDSCSECYVCGNSRDQFASPTVGRWFYSKILFYWIGQRVGCPSQYSYVIPRSLSETQYSTCLRKHAIWGILFFTCSGRNP